MMLATLVIASPLGPLRIDADGDELARIELAADPELAPREPPRRNSVLAAAAAQLAEYFAGTRRTFELPLAPRGTAFQERVWRALGAIPYGETRSYGDVARAIGRPAASRAVGAANGKNPIAIVVPCHRVIGAGGELVGYAGGLAIKRWLLAHERGHAARDAAELGGARA